MVPSDRAIYKDRHARIIIECPESDSPLRGRIHLRRLSLRSTSTLLQPGGGAYIFANRRRKMRAMRNFILGIIVGIAIAICCYRPYQIEAEYLRNISGGLPTTTGHTC